MQVHKILIATLLAASAAGAMSQELDPGETLQARTLAAPRLHLVAARSRDLAPVIAAVRGADASAPAQVAQATVPDTAWASRRFAHGYARHWLHGDRRPAAVVQDGHIG